MHSIGERLKIERERLGLSQMEICSLTGVTRKTQFNYENNERYPDASYLQKLLENGGDIIFILTGERNLQSVDNIDKKILCQTIELVELLLKKMGKKIPIDRKAEIISTLYSSFAAQHHVEPAIVNQMMELIA